MLPINLKKIRNDKKDFELVKFTLENNRILFNLEQDSINIVFFKKYGYCHLNMEYICLEILKASKKK